MQMLIIDSREKPKAIGNIIKTIEEANIPYMVSKLPVGDYMDYNRPGLIIDRKQNIAELAKNCTSDRVRFRDELERAKAVGAKLIILVEQNRFKDRGEWIHVDKIEDLVLWSGPYTTMKGERVYKVLASWCSKYDLEIQFCDKQSTGKRILQSIYDCKV